MAYNALPRSAQEILPAPPQAGASRARSEPGSRPALRQSAAVGVSKKGSAVGTDQTAAAASALLRFLILLVILSALTCLYVWQANSISAIKGDTQIMRNEIEELDIQNTSLMLEYSSWDAPGYIDTESSDSGMVTGQAPLRVQLPHSSLPDQAAKAGAGPIGHWAAWLSGSLVAGSEPR
jgi:hypothetical protein